MDGEAGQLTGEDRLPQAWVPRVVNLATAVLLLLFLVPLYTHLGGRPTSTRVMLVFVSVPFGVLAMACLASAVRPGSLGRVVRKGRKQDS